MNREERKCIVFKCDKKHLAKGYCTRHYQQIKHHGKIYNSPFDPNGYELKDGRARFFCWNDKYFICDEADVEVVKKFRWHINVQGYAHHRVNETKEHILLHRLLTNCPDNMEVDHINHVRHDNRRSNLKVVTRQQNMQNLSVRSDSNTGVSGVNLINHSGKYIALVSIDGKRKSLGTFEKIEDAIIVRKETEKKLWGIDTITKNKKELLG